MRRVPAHPAFVVYAWLIWVSPGRGEVLPVQVSHNSCETVLATPHPGTQFYLIVGSLADGSRTSRISVRTDRSPGPENIPSARDEPGADWSARVEAQARFLERQRRQRPSLDRFPPLEAPP